MVTPEYADVIAASVRIRELALKTPLKPSLSLSDRSHSVFFKLESCQPIGSFKIRGAANKILSLSADEKLRGVITASTGNHGKAVAYAAGVANIRCVVCLSNLVPANKILAIRALGAEVDIFGQSQDEAMARAEARSHSEGLIEIPPFDDKFVVAGQGTIGKEILEELPNVRTIIVPVSGGGLAAGVSLAAKSIDPNINVIGVSSAACPAMKLSLEAGHPIDVPELPSVADSLGGGITLKNRITFAMIRDLVDEIMVVSEAELVSAIQYAFWRERLVLEGAAAASLAVLLRLNQQLPSPVVSILTGDNIDPQRFIEIVSERRPDE